MYIDGSPVTLQSGDLLAYDPGEKQVCILRTRTADNQAIYLSWQRASQQSWLKIEFPGGRDNFKQHADLLAATHNMVCNPLGKLLDNNFTPWCVFELSEI